MKKNASSFFTTIQFEAYPYLFNFFYVADLYMAKVNAGVFTDGEYKEPVLRLHIYPVKIY